MLKYLKQQKLNDINILTNFPIYETTRPLKQIHIHIDNQETSKRHL